MHISSLWGEYSSGSFGKEAFEFVDFLKDSGFSYWQVLPFVVPDECNSPYKSYSTFGGNPYFVNLELLFEAGLLSQAELDSAKQGTPYFCEFDRLKNERVNLLINASKNANDELKSKINAFLEKYPQIKEFCKFMALKAVNNEKEWVEWQEKEYSEEVYFGWCFIQYEFFTQWASVKKYANDNGISIIGDIPIYVSFDSADVLYNKKMFLMDEANHLTDVAGVPPDYFSEDGQLWGNPLYDWAEMEKDGFSWWKERLSFALELFDGVRIDHFRGFESFYAIPYGNEDATVGEWMKGPNCPLFFAAEEKLGRLNIIAEDLGFITPEVREMLDLCGYPGMKVLQFGFSSGDNEHLPHNFTNTNCFAYTGTHDNETLNGWVAAMDRNSLKFAKKYLNVRKKSEIPMAVIRAAWGSIAEVAAAQMQDFLDSPKEGRMNTPSTLGNNWQFRTKTEQFTPQLAKKIKKLNKIYNR